MAQLVYYIATSLDGFIARENGSFDFFLMEGEHVKDFLESISDFDTVLMGRKTYQVGLDLGVVDPYPKMRSYVFSRTLKESPSPNVTIVDETPSNFVRGLKNDHARRIWLCGGAELASELFAEGLVDEVVVKLNPVLIGSGIPLLRLGQNPVYLELTDHKIYENGVLFLYYRVKN